MPCLAGRWRGHRIGALPRQGLVAAAGASDAELVVLNTCTVTAFADEDVRKAVHRVHRENPAARILVTGCYAQRAPEEAGRITGGVLGGRQFA